jgi:hypothetical protein
MVWIPLTGFSPPHFCSCPKPGPGFPTSYVVVTGAKQTINYQHRIAATQKDHILYCTTRMKDKINVDSTMAISVKYIITL